MSRMTHTMAGIFWNDKRTHAEMMTFPCQKGNGGMIDDEGFQAGWVMCNLWHHAQQARDEASEGFRWYTDTALFEQAVEIGRYAGYEMTVPPEDSPEWNDAHTTAWVEFGDAPRPTGSIIWHRS